jgi:hypothetical protein
MGKYAQYKTSPNFTLCHELGQVCGARFATGFCARGMHFTPMIAGLTPSIRVIQ